MTNGILLPQMGISGFNVNRTNPIIFTAMSRKKAMCALSIIESLVFLLIDVLYMMDKLSIRAFIIVFAVVILVSIGVAVIIVRKTA